MLEILILKIIQGWPKIAHFYYKAIFIRPSKLHVKRPDWLKSPMLARINAEGIYFAQHNYNHSASTMSAITISASRRRGRSVTRSSNSRSLSRRRTMVSASRSVGRSARTQLYRTWPGPSRPMYFDPFPQRLSCVLRYAQSVNLDAPAGLAAAHLFRANSIFDPDYSTTGHQPYGHDTYQSIYNHYVVDKAVITVSPNSVPSNSTLGISLTDDASVSLDYDQVKETKNTRFIPLNGASSPVTLNMTYNKNSFFLNNDDTSVGASFGANPVEGAFFQVWQTGNLPGNNPTALAVQVTITYYVSCWEMKDLGIS